MRKTDKEKSGKKSLYDIKTPNIRKGISGWKLTRRPHEWLSYENYPMIVGE